MEKSLSGFLLLILDLLKSKKPKAVYPAARELIIPLTTMTKLNLGVFFPAKSIC